MNETSEITTDTAPQPEALDEDALRRRLINRIALAGVAIVALLGGLAIIDTVYVSPPLAPIKMVATQPIAEAVKLDNGVDLSGVALSSVAVTAQQLTQAPEPPKLEAIPTIKSRGEPEESSSPSMPLPKQPPTVVEPRAVVAPAISFAPAPTSQALKPGAEGPRPFVLQMGVFNNVDNAQELLARLQKNGLPAQIEARVQVGPFTTKAEADIARAKLKAMGLDPGLLMSAHR